MLWVKYCLPADNLRAACDQVVGDLKIPLPKTKSERFTNMDYLNPDMGE